MVPVCRLPQLPPTFKSPYRTTALALSTSIMSFKRRMDHTQRSYLHYMRHGLRNSFYLTRKAVSGSNIA